MKATLKEVHKAKLLEGLDAAIGRAAMTSKYAREHDVTFYRLNGFNGEDLDVEIVYDRDYKVNKKVHTLDMIDWIQNGKVYIVNPSFCNKYFKQRWYQEYRGY